MLCDRCHKNQATMHMQQIVNGVKAEFHLCPECAATPDVPISFENLFHGFLGSILSMTAGNASNAVTKVSVAECPVCGMSYDRFKATGKLGCEECYHTFANEMDALLKNMQGSIRHEGKFPRRSCVAMQQKREVDRLRVMLSKAVEEENYEEAARLRDRIRSMEVEL